MTAPATTQQPAEQSDPELAWLAAWFLLLHQAEQRSIAGRVVKRLQPLWHILDFRDLQKTQLPWIEAVTPVLQDGYERSQIAAARFLADYRHASVPAAEDLPALTRPAAPVAVSTSDEAARALEASVQAAGIEPVGETAAASIPVAEAAATEIAPAAEALPQVVEDTPMPVRQSAVSMLATGPGEVKRQMPATEQDAMKAGRVLSSRVAVRIVTDGGRNVVQRAVDLDREAAGFARVLNDRPCSFCAMLASRGAVYKASSFRHSDSRFRGEGVAKVHDGCRCGLKVVYRGEDSKDATAQALSEQWDAMTKGHSGDAAIRAFRRTYVPPLPEGVPEFDPDSLDRVRAKLIRQGFGADSTQVRWIDVQRGEFGAEPGDARKATRVERKRASMVADRADAAVDAARRHLPTLEKTLASLRERGLGADAAPVQWHEQQIERFKAVLAA